MGGRYKILIIDDNKETVAGLKSFLQKEYSIVAAFDGFEGIQAFENAQGEINLVITDLVMPSISGTTLIEAIKKKYPETPIIAMTGYGHHPKEIASEAKADLILDKPFEMEVLEKAIKNLLIKSSSYPSQNSM